MKKMFLILGLFIMTFTFSQNGEQSLKKDTIAMRFANTITIKDLKEDLTTLASDALEGRETGRRGQKMAAVYIQNHFKEIGLEGPVETNTNPYFQNVPLITSKPGDIYVKHKNDLLINIKDCMYYGSAYTSDETSVELVFGGDGNLEFLQTLDVNNKAVLINTTNRAQRQSALKFVQENGAKMLFVIYANDEMEYAELHSMYKNYLNRETISLDVNEVKKEAGILFVSPTDGANFFGVSFEKLQKSIDSYNTGKIHAHSKIKPTIISYKISYDSKKIISENVLGYCEGSDLKEEVLVITAHYDHEGIKNGEIYNGADDDASGTSAVMELAEAFAKAKAAGYGPRRSILFMTVTAEEKGLLGSEYYVTNPIFPLENTIADLNIDMIGRIGKEYHDAGDYVGLVGSDKLSTDLHEINEQANATYMNLNLDYSYNDENHPSRVYYRSDHWNFAKNGIPIIFFRNGTHEDYHRPTDTIDKIEFDLLHKRTQLIFYTAWELVNRDERIVVDKNPKPTF